MNECTRLLKVKYPTARYVPLADCPYCGGSGEREYQYVVGTTHFSAWRACMCLFVNHVYIRNVAEARKQAAKGEIA